jgi:hypothetical protein
MHRGLRTYGRKVGLCARTCSYLDESEVGVTCCDGLEGKIGDASLPVDSCDVGRTGGGDGHQTITLITMDDGDGLSVTREQISGVDVNELEDGWVELKLNWYGIEVASIGR